MSFHRPSQFGGCEPTSSSPLRGSGGRDAQLEIKVDRLRRDMTDVTRQFAELARSIRTEQPYNATTVLLEEWARQITALQRRSEDVFESLRHAALSRMFSSPPRGSLVSSPDTAGIANSSSPNNSSSRAGNGSIGTAVPSIKPRRSVADVAPAAVPGTSAANRLRVCKQQQQQQRGAANLHESAPAAPAHFFAETQSGGLLQVRAHNPDAAMRVTNLGRALFAFLDATMHAVQAEKAAIFVPHNADTCDLKAVVATGFGPECLLGDLRLVGGETPQAVCLRTYMMIVVHRGLNPPTAAAPKCGGGGGGGDGGGFQEALAALTKVQAALSDRGADAEGEVGGGARRRHPRPPQHGKEVRGEGRRDASSSPSTSGGGAAGVTSAQALRSKYWSVLCAPIRGRYGTERAVGVLCLYNKNAGRSNFSFEDEHIGYGAAQIASTLMQRAHSMEYLSSAYDPVVPLPPLPRYEAAGGSGSGGGGVEEKTTALLRNECMLQGTRSQLVYRTWNPADGKDVRILNVDGSSAQQLSERTPVALIADHIEHMQKAWREAVLLNLEFQRTHDLRTRYIANLLQRARVAEYKNEVLSQQRTDGAHMSEDERQQLRLELLGTDYEPSEQLDEGALEERAHGFGRSPSVPERGGEPASLDLCAASLRTDRSEGGDSFGITTPLRAPGGGGGGGGEGGGGSGSAVVRGASVCRRRTVTGSGRGAGVAVGCQVGGLFGDLDAAGEESNACSTPSPTSPPSPPGAEAVAPQPRAERKVGEGADLGSGGGIGSGDGRKGWVK